MNTAARSEEQARALAHLAPMAMQAQAYAALSKSFQAKYGRRRCYASQGAANAYDMGWANWPSDPRGAFDGPEAHGFFDRDAYAEGRKDQSEDDAPLLIELKHAHALLMLALKHMTSAQKSRFAADSEAAGIGTEGATRYHERAAAIAAAEGTTP